MIDETRINSDDCSPGRTTTNRFKCHNHHESIDKFNKAHRCDAAYQAWLA